MVEAWSVSGGDAPSPLIVHVPHAGTWIPAAERERLLLDDRQLKLEVGRMTDWHTDRLALDALGSPGAVFVNRVSRLVVDPERFTDDTEAMAAIGMGAVYQVTSQLAPLRQPDPADDLRLIGRWFRPYAAAFAAAVDGALAAHDWAVIVDLHSYPSRPLPYEPDPAAPRPGVCVGTDRYHTPAWLSEEALRQFAGVAGGTGVDTPFAGTYVPLARWRRTPEVVSVMVEIRRDLYQHEPGGPAHGGYRDIVERLSRLFAALGARDGPP